MGIQKSVSKVLFSNVWTSVAGLLSLTFFARELGAGQLGSFFLFLSVARFSRIPVNFGIGGALTKRVSEGDSPGSYLTTALLLVCGSLTVFSLLLLVLRHQVNSYLGAQLTGLLIVLIIVQEGAALGRNVLSGELRVGETGTLKILRNTMYVGSGVFFVLYGFGARGLIFATILAEASIAALAAYRVSIPLEHPSLYHVKSLIDYGKWGPISHLDTELYNWADIAILGVFMTNEFVGAYEIAWRVSSVLTLLARAVQSTIVPHTSSMDADGREDEIRKLVPYGITASLFLVVPGVFGIYILGESFLRIMFSSEFVVAYPALLVLSAGKIIESVDGVLQGIVAGIDRPDVRGGAVLVSALSNVTLNFILIPWVGLVGAALATTISFFSSTVIVGIFAYRKIQFKLQIRRIGWCGVSSVLMTGLLFAINSLVHIDSLLSVALIVVLGALSYFSLSFLYRPLREDILNIYNKVTHH